MWQYLKKLRTSFAVDMEHCTPLRGSGSHPHSDPQQGSHCNTSGGVAGEIAKAPLGRNSSFGNTNVVGPGSPASHTLLSLATTGSPSFSQTQTIASPVQSEWQSAEKSSAVGMGAYERKEAGRRNKRSKGKVYSKHKGNKFVALSDDSDSGTDGGNDGSTSEQDNESSTRGLAHERPTLLSTVQQGRGMGAEAAGGTGKGNGGVARKRKRELPNSLQHRPTKRAQSDWYRLA